MEFNRTLITLKRVPRPSMEGSPLTLSACCSSQVLVCRRCGACGWRGRRGERGEGEGGPGTALSPRLLPAGLRSPPAIPRIGPDSQPSTNKQTSQSPFSNTVYISFQSPTPQVTNKFQYCTTLGNRRWGCTMWARFDYGKGFHNRRTNLTLFLQHYF